MNERMTATREALNLFAGYADVDDALAEVERWEQRVEGFLLHIESLCELKEAAERERDEALQSAIRQSEFSGSVMRENQRLWEALDEIDAKPYRAEEVTARYRRETTA